MRFLKDDVVKAKLASALPLSEVDASKYDAVFYPGGHGPMFDLPTDVHNIDIATKVSALRPLHVQAASVDHWRSGIQRWKDSCSRLPRTSVSTIFCLAYPHS